MLAPPLFAHLALNIRPACQLLATWFKLCEARLWLSCPVSICDAGFDFAACLVFVCPSLSLYIYIYIYIYASVSLSIYIYISLYTYIYIYTAHPPISNVYAYRYVRVQVHVMATICTWLYMVVYCSNMVAYGCLSF